MRTRGAWFGLAALAVAGVSAAPLSPVLYPDREFDSGLGSVRDVVFSADGRLLAAGGAAGFAVWDAQTGDLVRTDTARGDVPRVSLAPQGTLVALGSASGVVTVVDLRSGSSREVARHERAVTAIAFNSDGRLGVSGDARGGLQVWDPGAGAIGPLRDGGHQQEIIGLSFNGNALLSVSRDLRVVTWDVSGQRATRRGTLQSEVRGRTFMPAAVAAEPSGAGLVLGAQLVSEQRGGSLAGRDAPARPGDLRRDNVLIPYDAASGISGDPVTVNEFQAERLALGPSGCAAVFTSFYRDQPRVHIWGLVRLGDDLVRQDLTERATALALEPGGRLLAAASGSGRIRTWRLSGATAADCASYRQQAAPTAGPTFTLGSETSPLITGGDGYRMAVLRFEATGLDAGLGDAVAEMIAGELANSPTVTVIERSAIDAILREMEVQRSGLTTADAVKIGQGLNARKVLFGSVRRFGETTYVTTARLVDVETQRVEGSREVTCENCREQDLPRAVGVLRRAIVP